MTTIIMRSALIAHGGHPTSNLHSIIIDHEGRHVITWDMHLEQRREIQRRILQRRLEDKRVWRAVKIWVAFYDRDFFGGWQAFIENRDGYAWVDRDRRFLKPQMMSLFPMVLPLGDTCDRWEDWKIAFAKQFKRRTHHRRPLGVALAWHDGDRLVLPTKARN